MIGALQHDRKDNSHQHDESLVQQHALKRLDKVEEKQKPYKKKKNQLIFVSVLWLYF